MIVLVTFTNLSGEKLERGVTLNSRLDEIHAIEEAKKAIRMYYRIPSKNILDAKIILNG